MKQKLLRLSKYAINCALIVAIAFTLSIMINSVTAAVVEWNEPTCTDPEICNVSSLVDTSDLMQKKTGQLNLVGADPEPDLEHTNRLSVYADLTTTDTAIYAEQNNASGYAIYASGNITASGTICDSVGCIGGGGSTAWGDLTGVPAGFADGVDNTGAGGVSACSDCDDRFLNEGSSVTVGGTLTVQQSLLVNNSISNPSGILDIYDQDGINVWGPIRWGNPSYDGFTRASLSVSNVGRLSMDITRDMYFDGNNYKFIWTSPDNDRMILTNAGNLSIDGDYSSGGADYAEWFDGEGETKAGDVLGVNIETGKVRKYQAGDKFVGIYSSNPGFIGNSGEVETEISEDQVLVGLMGQLEFNKDQVKINDRTITTLDGVYIGILLSNGKAFVGTAHAEKQVEVPSIDVLKSLQEQIEELQARIEALEQ